MNKAKKDASGDALDGLKGAYIDHFINKASVGALDELGEQSISGKAMLSLIGKHHSSIKELFSPEEIARRRLKFLRQEIALLNLWISL